MTRATFKTGESFETVSPDELKQILSTTLRDQLRPPLQRWLNANSKGSTYDAGGTQATIDFGEPPNGYVWDLRRVTISGANPLLVVAGVAFIFAGDPVPAKLGGTPQPSEIRDCSGFQNSTTAIPIPSPWSRHQITIRHGERLYIVATGLAAGPGTLYATAQVDQELAATVTEYEA